MTPEADLWLPYVHTHVHKHTLAHTQNSKWEGGVSVYKDAMMESIPLYTNFKN